MSNDKQWYCLTLSIFCTHPASLIKIHRLCLIAGPQSVLALLLVRRENKGIVMFQLWTVKTSAYILSLKKQYNCNMVIGGSMAVGR